MNALIPIDIDYTDIISKSTEEEISNYIRPDEVQKMLICINNRKAKRKIQKKDKDLMDKRDYVLVSILWQTGARISEILSLRKIDINRDGIMMFTEKKRLCKKRKNYKGDWIPLTKEKLKKKIVRRNIPIRPELYADIIEYYAEKHLLPDAKIFDITRGRTNQILNKISKEAGITYKNIHPHLFRHGFAVNFLKCGGLLPNLMVVLGHNHIQTTMIYLKLSGADIRDDINKMIF